MTTVYAIAEIGADIIKAKLKGEKYMGNAEAPKPNTSGDLYDYYGNGEPGAASSKLHRPSSFEVAAVGMVTAAVAFWLSAGVLTVGTAGWAL